VRDAAGRSCPRGRHPGAGQAVPPVHPVPLMPAPPRPARGT